MPITTQITNTAVDITPTIFAISGASIAFPYVTIHAVGHTFSNGDLISVAGLVPDSYNITGIISSVATDYFNIANTPVVPLLSATNGYAIKSMTSDYVLATSPVVYKNDSSDQLPTGNYLDSTGITHSTLLDLEANSLALSTAFASTNIDAKTSGVAWFTSNASSTGYINIRGDSSTTLDSYMKVNDTLSLSVCVTNGGTAYYINAVKIDGTTQTVKWIGGNAPSAGNASAVDLYTFSILKTASATFTVIGNMASAS